MPDIVNLKGGPVKRSNPTGKKGARGGVQEGLVQVWFAAGEDWWRGVRRLLKAGSEGPMR